MDANAGLVDALGRPFPHRVSALPAECIVGRDSSSTLRTIHDARLQYQVSGFAHCLLTRDAHHIGHVVKTRGTAEHPVGGPNCTAREYRAIRRAMGELESLALAN